MRISKYFVILTTNPYIDELFLIKKYHKEMAGERHDDCCLPEL